MEQLDEILAALEVPAIDDEARGCFQRMLFRQKYVGGDARGQIIMTIRCITESTGNENALIGPVVRAVHLVMTPALMDRGLALIEAFDQIDLISILRAMESLAVFTDGELAGFYRRAIWNKLRAILEPAAQATKPIKPASRKARGPHRAGRPKHQTDQLPARMAA